MSFIKNLKKISPEVAELYEEIYEDCISEVLSQSFHYVFIEF